jgi:hypothetical protein
LKKTHEASFEKLQSELDITSIVKALRVSAFVNNLALTRPQRYFVGKFAKYSLTDDENDSGSEHCSDEG